MLPSRTLNSCGSSSIDVARINEPNFVFLGSPSWLHATSESVFTRIERNFSMVKGLPSLPTLFCRKSMGPGEERRTPIAAISIIGDVRIIRAREPMMSTARFMAAFAGLSSGVVCMLIIGRSPICSICLGVLKKP